jgi:hypothetical protein
MGLVHNKMRLSKLECESLLHFQSFTYMECAESWMATILLPSIQEHLGGFFKQSVQESFFFLLQLSMHSNSLTVPKVHNIPTAQYAQ